MKAIFRLSLCSCLFFFLLTNVAFSQVSFDDDEKPSFKDRIYFGGNFGLQFGSITAIDVSPIVGYMITPKLSGGVGITYQYLKYKDRYNNASFSTNIYGGKVFGRYNLTQQFFAHSEYEVLSLEYFNVGEARRQRINVPGFFIGGGYFQPIGERAGISITALYNLLHDELRSPYRSPIVLRVGFNL